MFCLPPPDIPVAQGGATFGAKFLSADLTLTGVIGPVPQGAWVAFWTPWQAGNGQINAAGTVASPAAIAPGGLTLTGRKVRGAKRLAGRVTQAGAGVATRVSIFGAAGRAALRRIAVVSAKRERHLHVRRAADVEGDEVPGPRGRRGPDLRRGLQRSSARSPRPVRERDRERLQRDVAERHAPPLGHDAMAGAPWGARHPLQHVPWRRPSASGPARGPTRGSSRRGTRAASRRPRSGSATTPSGSTSSRSTRRTTRFPTRR